MTHPAPIAGHRWLVRIDRFPLAEPGAVLAETTARTKAEAQHWANDAFPGQHVIVERQTRGASR